MAACASQCQVVEDVALGWEDFCVGLQLVNTSTFPEDCQRSCCDDPNCEVWQWGNMRDAATLQGPAMCYNGKGLECSSDRYDDFVVLKGQRVSHGPVKRTNNLDLGKWCTGAGMRQANVTLVGKVGEAQRICRDVCYRDATCSVWELSTSKGCWFGVADPGGCVAGVPGAADMVAGESVERACGADTLRAKTDYLMVFGILGAVAVLLTFIGMVVVLVCARIASASGTLSKSKGHSDRQLLAVGVEEE